MDYKQPNITYKGGFKNGNYNIQHLRNFLSKDISEMINYYNISKDYTFNFFILISHNAYIDFTPDDYAFIHYADYENIQSMILAMGKPIGAILIGNNITKKQLKKWIDDNWEKSIFPSLQTLMPKRLSIKGTYTNAELDTEIYSLRLQNKSYRQISDILAIKLPMNENVLDVAWLKLRVSRYKKKNIK